MNERGSILVETLIATAILSMILVAAFQTLHDSARRARRIADQRTAMLIAQSRLAAYPLNRAPAAGSRSGEELGYRWQVEVAAPREGNLAGTVSLAVTVASRTDPAAHVRLDSLRPAP